MTIFIQEKVFPFSYLNKFTIDFRSHDPQNNSKLKKFVNYSNATLCFRKSYIIFLVLARKF